jgi:hypothetical protein
MKGHALNPLNFSSCVNVEKSVSADINPCQGVMLAVGFVVGYLQYILTVIDLPRSFSPSLNLTVCLSDLVLLYHAVD